MTIANTLTGLEGKLYAAVDLVSRELVGMTNSVNINAEMSKAAKGKAVTIPVSTPTTGVDTTPGMNPPDPADKETKTRSLTITKSRSYEFGFTGEETLLLENGAGYVDRQTAEIAQAIRGLTNEIEADLCALYKGFSRAYGTAGTTPFATNLKDTAQILRLLQDNGAPAKAGWNLCIDTIAGANMRTLAQLTDVNRAGESSFLRQGTILPIHNGLAKESGQISDHTKGTGTSYQTNSASLAVGSTIIPIDTGSGTVVAGDVVTFAGDSNKYVVKTGVAAAGNLVIAEPGLRTAVADDAAMTILDNYTPNMAFTPDAVSLALRKVASPEGGDLAVATFTIVDPFSGLLYEFAEYKGYLQNKYEVRAAWGVGVTKEEHTALLLG